MADDGEPSVAVKKALFALSGNRCAFMGCTKPMVDAEGRVLGEIVHIKGRRAGSPRYDPSQSEAQRSGFHNLLVMCGYHHTVTNDEFTYPADRLLGMKYEHEKRVAGHELDPSSIQISKVGGMAVSHHQSGGITAGRIENINFGGTPGTTQISDDALQVLFVAAQIGIANAEGWKGKIMVHRSIGGIDLVMLGGEKVTFSDPEQSSRMSHCLDSLRATGYLKAVGPKGQMLEMTKPGYDRARLESWTLEQIWWREVKSR